MRRTVERFLHPCGHRTVHIWKQEFLNVIIHGCAGSVKALSA